MLWTVLNLGTGQYGGTHGGWNRKSGIAKQGR
jgi:hypothetical protein